MTFVSVILCAHNPRPEHFARTLAGLRAQTAPPDMWELLVIDNASSPPLELPPGVFPASARVIREPTLGTFVARLRGIGEARGDLLVYVDDDNVLDPDYLAQAVQLAQREPALGAFGGQNRGEFEVPPSPWFAARLERLAIREFTTAVRTRQVDPALAPPGAGLCFRKEVAQRYRATALSDARRRGLGPKGQDPGAGEDTDLALTACEMGLEIGRCPELRLTHLIPAERLTLRYFARLTRRQAQSELRLLELHPAIPNRRQRVRAARWALWKWACLDALLSLGSPRRA